MTDHSNALFFDRIAPQTVDDDYLFAPAPVRKPSRVAAESVVFLLPPPVSDPAVVAWEAAGKPSADYAWDGDYSQAVAAEDREDFVGQ